MMLKANPFATQLAMSPFVRFALSDFPLQHVWEQYRMIDTLCNLPSLRGYDGMLRTSREALSRRMTTKQKNILVVLLGADLSTPKALPTGDQAHFEDQRLRYWLLDVRGGRTQIDPALQNSRLNVANVDVTLRFFKALVRSKFLPPSEIRILTFYNAQEQRYINGIYDLQKELSLTQGGLDDVVHTSDSFPGREATCVILDVVVTKCYGEGTLGHAGDEKKANVSFTRARDFRFVASDTTILDSKYLGEKEGRVEFILVSMMGLMDRKAFKQRHSNKSPESELAKRFARLEIAENDNYWATE
jgi:AAA domain